MTSGIGITLRACPGLGDTLHFTSIPENYYRATGQKLIDVNREWVFDFNPFVDRETIADTVVDLWCATNYKAPPNNRRYYTSLAERNALLFDIPIKLGHPRLYRFENQPIKYNTAIAPFGRSQGKMPEKIIQHILKTRDGVAQIGLKTEPKIEAEYDLRGDNIWDAVEAIASSREFIGNTGTTWIAACFPRVWNKLLLTRFPEDILKDYLGMDYDNKYSHWYDHRFSYYNVFDYDIGISLSYLKI